MSEAKVACIGEALIVLVQAVAGPLEDASSFVRSIGGAEVNVAIGLASQGVRSAILTRVGDDGFGRHVIAECRRHGVDVSAIEVDRVRATGLYVKEIGGSTGGVDDIGTGASRMIYYRANSASSAFSSAYLERAAATFAGAAMIHLSGITPALSDSARAMCLALARSRPQGKLLSFDVNWRPQLWVGREAEGATTLLEIAQRSDLVFLGRTEAQIILGTDDPTKIRRLLPKTRWVVIKNDREPAVGFDGHRRVEEVATRVKPKEAIGAGDAFAAGFIAALLDGKDLSLVMKNAHQVAAVALKSTRDHVGTPR